MSHTSIMQGIVNDWNAKCPVGTLVEYDWHDGTKKTVRTKSPAVLICNCAMIELEGVVGRAHLGCCRTIPEERIEPEIAELSGVESDQGGGWFNCFKNADGKVVSPLCLNINDLFKWADEVGYKVRWVRYMPKVTVYTGQKPSDAA